MIPRERIINLAFISAVKTMVIIFLMFVLYANYWKKVLNGEELLAIFFVFLFAGVYDFVITYIIASRSLR